MKIKDSRYGTIAGLALMVITLCIATTTDATAQCIDHPDGRTAVKFNNETRYDLTFFIDREPSGTFVPSKQISEERAVPAGMHLLSAMAKIADKEHWVWVFNDIPSGQVCTWNVLDPPRANDAIRGRGFTTPFVPTAR